MTKTEEYILAYIWSDGLDREVSHKTFSTLDGLLHFVVHAKKEYIEQQHNFEITGIFRGTGIVAEETLLQAVEFMVAQYDN